MKIYIPFFLPENHKETDVFTIRPVTRRTVTELTEKIKI